MARDNQSDEIYLDLMKVAGYTGSMNLRTLIQTLGEGMTAARDAADGQTKAGSIIIPVDAYNALYYAAYKVKKELEKQAEETEKL